MNICDPYERIVTHDIVTRKRSCNWGQLLEESRTSAGDLLKTRTIVGIWPPRGSNSFTLGCGGGSINSGKRSKTLPTGVFATSRPRGWGLLVTDRCVLNHHNWTGSFKMKRFEIFCSDPFTPLWPERYAAPRASLDVAVRAGTKQTTPRGLDAAVSGFGGPCTLPLRRRRCDARAQERSRGST